MNIARGVEAPLKIDKAILEGNFGKYARILIDVDLSKDIPDSLMIEREKDTRSSFWLFTKSSQNFLQTVWQ